MWIVVEEWGGVKGIVAGGQGKILIKN